MNDGPDNILRTRGICHTYHTDGVDTPVLHGIDLDIRRGEFVIIMGPSGCGKSTLLNILGLMMQPTAGSVEIDGVCADLLDDAHRTALRRDKLGFVFQRFNLLGVLSAEQNVAMTLKLRRCDIDGRVLDALAKVGLTEKRRNRPAALSVGEQQRVAIARALVGHPALLLADEPTGNLDSRNASEVLDLLSDLNHSEGLTTVMITHNERLAARADRILLMDDGRLEQG
jgi:putative ABC transport system ATP-binding protein